MDYSDMLSANGYCEEWRRKVLQKAMIGYQRILLRVDEGKTWRNMLGKETRMKRRAKKLTGKANWFREERKREGEP